MNSTILLIENIYADAKATETLVGDAYSLVHFPYDQALREPASLLGEARQQQAALVLIDVVLRAGGGGFDLCTYLLEHGWPRNRVALHTIYSNHELVMDYAKERGVEVIEKGIDRNRLQSELRRIIGQ